MTSKIAVIKFSTDKLPSFWLFCLFWKFSDSLTVSILSPTENKSFYYFFFLIIEFLTSIVLTVSHLN